MKIYNNTALVIVDLQFDYCATQGFAGKLGRDLSCIDQMLTNLKSFYRKFKKIGFPIIFTKYIARKDISPKNLRINKNREERARLCLRDSRGSEFYGIKPKTDDIVIAKYYYDSFAGTTLLSVLESLKIKTLLISGVRTELGVDSTAKRAVSEGFTMIVLKDLIATYKENLPQHEVFLKVFNRYYGYAVTANNILDILDN
jgi:ureidoacrylate peracid hydrolase